MSEIVVDIIVNTTPQIVEVVVPAPPQFAEVIVQSNELTIERRSDFVSPYNYIGKAVVGSMEGASVWTIKRIEVAVNGSVPSVLKATGVKWTERLTETYI